MSKKLRYEASASKAPDHYFKHQLKQFKEKCIEIGLQFSLCSQATNMRKLLIK